MYMEFEKRNFALSDINAAMMHVSVSFGWLAYLQIGGGSQICGLEQADTVGWSTVSVNGALN